MRLFLAVMAASCGLACSGSVGGAGGGSATGGGSASGGGSATGGGSGGGASTAPTVFVGSGNGAITVYAFDSTTGALTQTGALSNNGNPSYLAISPAHDRLYAVDETGSKVNAFALSADGGLTRLNSQSSQGTGPAHLSVDPTGQWVLVSNYGSGDIAALPATDAGVGSSVSSTNAGLNAHQIQTDSAGTHVFVPCLGSDYVALYDFAPATGQLTPHAPATVATAAGAGPRHLALHPNGSYAYLVNETDSTITAFSLSAGTLSPLQTQSTVAPSFPGSNTCAHVRVHPGGAFVFSSNRGEDTIVSWQVQPDGKLALIGRVPTGAPTPRDFTLTPDGRWLLVGNQTSNSVQVFSVDVDAGTLSATGSPVTVNSPAFVGAWSL